MSTSQVRMSQKTQSTTMSQVTQMSKNTAKSVTSKSSQVSSSTYTTDCQLPAFGFWPGLQAPRLEAVPCLRSGGQVDTFTLESLQGKMVVLLFHPVDFGYIGSTELQLLDELEAESEVVANLHRVLPQQAGHYNCIKHEIWPTP